MDAERSMEIILQQQAKFEAKFEQNFLKSSERMDQIERGLAGEQRDPRKTQRLLNQTNRVVGRLASRGITLRSDVGRHEKAIARHELMMSEVEDKLNALSISSTNPSGAMEGKSVELSAIR